MATAMESPLAFPDSPMEPDDSAYPCKGCGLVSIFSYEPAQTGADVDFKDT